MSKTESLEKRSKNTTEARRKPLQARAQKRHQQILDTTAELLEQVGVDDLTTILIAKKLDISVGSLYHYFPNKMSILHALSQQWLNEITHALDDIDATMTDGEDLKAFTEHSINRLLKAYRSQLGILHLVQAMFSIPELRTLDEEHDKLMATRLSAMFTRLGFKATKGELSRIASVYIELIHALSLLVMEQSGQRANKTINDLKATALTLLTIHR